MTRRTNRTRRFKVGLIVTLLMLAAAGALLWNSPYAFMGAARRAGQWWLAVEQQSVLVGGHRWPYLESGPLGAAERSNSSSAAVPSRATPIVLLHGYGTSMDAMMTIMPWVSSGHRVIAPDLPGFGRHDEHSGEVHDGAFYAREVTRFMDALGIERATLVGTSMGGAIAAEVAVTYPERVDRLVLMAPAGMVAPVENDFMRRANSGENPLQLESAEDFDRVVNLVFHAPPPTPGPVRSYFVSEAQRRLPSTRRIDVAIESFLRQGLESRLGRISAPTLVLWGELDAVLDPSLLPRFVAEIPGAEGERIPNAGHVLFHDNASAVRDLIVPFLKTPTASSPSESAPPR